MITQAELNGFTGSDTIYRHWLNCFQYTEGVKYLAEQAQAYWLIDAIASYQKDPRITQDSMLQQIQFWKLQVNEDGSALLWCERDKDDVVLSQKIEFTEFPLKFFTLYLTHRTLLLPSEY